MAQAIDTRGLYTTWQGELAWLFDLRDSCVHYEGAFAPPQPHPLGMTVAPSQVAYSAENATRAVDLLLGILERCRDRPKPPAGTWSQGMRGAINELIGRRGGITQSMAALSVATDWGPVTQTSVGTVAVLGGGFIGAWWQGRGQQRIEQERRRQQAAEVLAEITVLLEEIDAIRFFFKFTNEDWLKAVEPFVSRHESLRMQLLALTTSPQ